MNDAEFAERIAANRRQFVGGVSARLSEPFGTVREFSELEGGGNDDGNTPGRGGDGLQKSD